MADLATPRALPVIEFRALPDCEDGWQVTIHDGPGHHGTGSTPALALMRASNAWYCWTKRKDTA